MSTLKTLALWLTTRLVGAIIALICVDILAGTVLAASPSAWGTVMVLMAILELLISSNARTNAPRTREAPEDTDDLDKKIAFNSGRLYELRRQMTATADIDDLGDYDNEELAELREHLRGKAETFGDGIDWDEGRADE